MSLTNKTIANTYKDLLEVDNSNNGLSTSAKVVKSGDGTSSCIFLSDDQLAVRPQNDNTTDIFSVKKLGGDSLLQVDGSNTNVKALGQFVNTNVKQFMLSSVNFQPTSTNWTMMDSIGGGRFNSTAPSMGSGSTPDTSLTISTTADDIVQCLWYLPFNITIDQVAVWFGADVSSGDDVQFSVMSYDIDTSNSSTSGDLSNGTEVAVSPSAIVGAGYEQAYYQSLTISSADVNSGKAITANVKMDGTSADLTINMQLVYHLRSA
tara:strand:- start:778 stop:1566 length:789 start_codon:yes stop_codon:yes gene_type:complete